MKYIYTDPSGREIALRVETVSGNVTRLVDVTDEVVIPAQQVYDDLVSEISMSGSHPGVCYEVITDRYQQQHQEVSWEGLTPVLRQQLVDYLEELRSESDNNEDDPFYNDGNPWTIQDTHF